MKMPDVEVQIVPVFDLSNVTDEMLNQLADLLWTRIRHRIWTAERPRTIGRG